MRWRRPRGRPPARRCAPRSWRPSGSRAGCRCCRTSAGRSGPRHPRCRRRRTRWSGRSAARGRRAPHPGCCRRGWRGCGNRTRGRPAGVGGVASGILPGYRRRRHVLRRVTRSCARPQTQLGNQKCSVMNQRGISMPVQIGRKNSAQQRRTAPGTPRRPAARRRVATPDRRAVPSRSRDRRGQRQHHERLERDRVELEDRAAQVQQPRQVARREPDQDEGRRAMLGTAGAHHAPPAPGGTPGRTTAAVAAHQISGFARSRIVSALLPFGCQYMLVGRTRNSQLSGFAW